MQGRARLGWNDFFQEQIEGDAPPPQVARVVEEQRGAYRVAGDFDGWAEVSGKFRYDARETARDSGICAPALVAEKRDIDEICAIFREIFSEY